MRAPGFWYRPDPGPWAGLLAPAAIVYRAAAAGRRRIARSDRIAAPVICVGNIVAGGAGKTPVVHALARAAQDHGLSPAIISRGYGGNLRTATQVDLTHHTAREVGDEAMLSAAVTLTVIGRNRIAAGTTAIAAGANLLILDDGLQNPSLVKDYSLAVFDGLRGIGNGRLLPAGPLRQTVAGGLAAADGVVIVGPDTTGLAETLPNIPIHGARLVPDDLAPDLTSHPVVAFAGIGNPDKFFTSLKECGCTLAHTYSFADHHTYDPEEIMIMVDKAAETNATLVTTAKDAVRLTPIERAMVTQFHVHLEWQNPDTPGDILKRAHNAYAAANN